LADVHFSVRNRERAIAAGAGRHVQKPDEYVGADVHYAARLCHFASAITFADVQVPIEGVPQFTKGVRRSKCPIAGGSGVERIIKKRCHGQIDRAVIYVERAIARTANDQVASAKAGVRGQDRIIADRLDRTTRHFYEAGRASGISNDHVIAGLD
jgi:hypothetical protein